MLYLCVYCKSVYYYELPQQVRDTSYCCGAVLKRIVITANTYEDSIFGGECTTPKTDIYMTEEPTK